jgi:hypothetical protein
MTPSRVELLRTTGEGRARPAQRAGQCVVFEHAYDSEQFIWARWDRNEGRPNALVDDGVGRVTGKLRG